MPISNEPPQSLNADGERLAVRFAGNDGWFVMAVAFGKN